MSQPLDIHTEVRRWIEKAEHDFRNSQYVLTMKEECPYDTVTYHCHQCAEKYLKAVLIYRRITFPKTHDLVVLFNLMSESDRGELTVHDVQPLNRYSIEARYPGDWEPINEEEARHAFALTEAVRQSLYELLSTLLTPES